MAGAGHTIEIGAPPEVVFALYERYDRHPEWQELVGAQITTPGPVGPGTRGFEVRRMLGREMRTPYEITAHEPPQRSAFRTSEGPIRFVPLRPVAALLARRVARNLPGHLARFKDLAEAQSAPSTARV